MLQEMALRTVNNMAKVIQKLLSDGKQLHDPESIQLCLEPGIRSRSEQVGCDSVVTLNIVLINILVMIGLVNTLPEGKL